MKIACFTAGLLGASLCLATLGGCQTDTAGVKDTVGAYSAVVDVSPDKATTAARKAVEDMKLLDVTSTGTKVDGRVTARTAQNDLVAINISQSGDNVSNVTVRVGVNDRDTSMEIIRRIKSNLHWFSGNTDNNGGYPMTNVAGTYSAMVDAAPDKVTEAARKSAEQLKLTDISSSGSKDDGKVTARTADDSAVTIDIQKTGENVSKVSIRVGVTGDSAVSKELFSGIKSNLHWF